MGLGRAGWYSHDMLDNAGRPSAEEIHPEWQPMARGDRIPSSGGARTWFEVLDLREPHHLVLGFHMVWPFRSARWAEPTTQVDQRATWSFVLRDVPGGMTRLLVRSRGVSRPGWLFAPWTAFFSTAHVPMQRKQLLGIRRRAERSRGRSPA
jgi:proline iminopeptidase